MGTDMKGDKVELVDLTVRRYSSADELPLWVQERLALAGRDWLDANMEIHDDRIYRVSIFPGEIDVLCLGLLPSDSSIEGRYSSADELPLWVQERLAVLMMMSLETPTVELVGVGRRISSNVYWVYKPETTS